MNTVTVVPTPEQLERFDHALHNLPAAPVDVSHVFANGMYARTIRLGAGVALAGRIHRTDQINILSEGIITVATEEGAVLIKGPYQFASPAGVKRVAMTLTPCVWTTICRTDATTPEQAEQELTCGTFAEYNAMQLPKEN